MRTRAGIILVALGMTMTGCGYVTSSLQKSMDGLKRVGSPPSATASATPGAKAPPRCG